MSVRVAMFGTKFMGKAHSHAYRSVNMFFPDAPRVEMKVIVGRDPEQTNEAANAYGVGRGVNGLESRHAPQ